MPNSKSVFADLLRECRKKHGLTQKEFANLSQVGLRTVEKIESGENQNPTMETFMRIMLLMSMPAPQKLPSELEWDRLPLLKETLTLLAGFDNDSIRLLNHTLPEYLSILNKVTHRK